MAADKFMLALVIAYGVMLRCSVSLNSYSGEKKPPMFGDYEAQRHWMEITFNLPIDKWYVNSTDNDLLYWGLDYPPLTAYHSFICGWIANKINPDWVTLWTSRGYESYNHKLFMRCTVLLADLAVYIPAVILLISFIFGNGDTMKKHMTIATVLTYPGLILIDHGHFQYNCVSLGFTVFAVLFMCRKQELLGSAFFVLALNYKQMELYHAFPFFFYLLGLSWKQQKWHQKFLFLASVGSVVIITFALCWLPFLRDPEIAIQVLRRLFPFNRGLYEDKVANIWCALSVLIKLKTLISIDSLVLICLVTTLLACLPSSIDLLLRPTLKKFMFAMINCSLAFFLFSFQVHEKSILIPALSVTLLLPVIPFQATWFLLVSTFSMFPLLERDRQILAYIALSLLFLIIVTNVFEASFALRKPVKALFLTSLATGLLLHFAKAVFPLPRRFPDLYPVLFAIISCAHFFCFFVYFNYLQFFDSSDDLPLKTKSVSKKLN